ncbi:glycosyltransferase family 4 protein [Alicyclobacillus fastidiosus]|uniref:Glycosyltransferase family 4 protein n=1 Tax=Alicyclobacillus fastidiosus TaxID=392011 RepID=A0ABV5AAJ3_9BACL|nr:glycosyltransferase family 4 protein [Alicyclobacillus fastidiosus]WEH07627.1 glycosyltransferase family 4 protein [Alicyclobacillus fastidiosus]
MNVLVVMPLGEFGGGAEQMLYTYLASRKGDTKVKLHVLFLSPGGLVEAIRQMGYPVAVISAGRVREVRRLVQVQSEVGKLLDTWQIERVLAWMPKAGIYVSLPTKQRRIPLFVWRHDIPSFLSRLDRWVLQFNRPAGLACSSELACRALQRTLRNSVEATSIHPGTPPLSYRPSEVMNIRRSVLQGEPGIIVGTVARLQPWKRIDLFLQSIALLHRTFPEVRALVVGGESHGLSKGYSSELHALGKELLGDAVVFAGEQRNVGDWLQAMDVFVLASQGEPFGISLVEALLAGKPVVACAGGGPEEIIDHHTVGTVVSRDPGPEEMAKAIGPFLQPEVRERAKQQNPIRGGAFSPHAMANRIDNWVSKVL